MVDDILIWKMSLRETPSIFERTILRVFLHLNSFTNIAKYSNDQYQTKSSVKLTINMLT